MPSSDTPLEIELEFARAESTGDPHAFRFAPQSYIVRTPRGGFGASEVAWDEDLLARLAAVRLAGQDPRLLADVGELMRRFLAPAGWELHEQQITAAVQQRRPVHVTIRSAAAELYALPWELLTLRATGQSLGGLPGALIRYEWPETATAVYADMSSGSGRVLVAWSAAGGAVPASEHIAAIRAAAAAGGLAFGAEDVLAHASPGRIAAELARAEAAGRPVAALHLLCHGGAGLSTFGLQLDGEAEGDAPVLLDPARLQQILAPYAATLRLVVLAACDSGNQGELGGLLGSAAQMLHRAGLAAVVASRYPLSVAGSQQLTAALYHRLLAERASLEQAFVAARTALGGDARRLDWASVQLYARARDGSATFPLVPPREPAAPPSVPSRPPRAGRPTALVAAGGAVAATLATAWLGGAFGGADRTPPPATAPPVEEARPVAADSSTKQTGALEAAPKDSATKDSATKDSATIEPPRPAAVEKPAAPGKKREPAPARPSVECTSGVKSYVRALLPPDGSRVVKLTIKAGSDGSVTATGADPSAVTGARERLKEARAEKIKQAAGDALPCHYSYEWTRPDGG